MLKLYKRVDGVLRYHEAWVEKENGVAVEHWGVVGERGEFKNHPLPKKRFNAGKFIDDILTPAAEQGFESIDDDDHAILLVEYAVDGFGTSADLDKRHALEDRLNETLGWTGVGHCDGGSIGSGSMEACCYVVDFEIAKRVIEQDLAGTQFADFTRIYDEGADD